MPSPGTTWRRSTKDKVSQNTRKYQCPRCFLLLQARSCEPTTKETLERWSWPPASPASLGLVGPTAVPQALKNSANARAIHTGHSDWFSNPKQRKGKYQETKSVLQWHKTTLCFPLQISSSHCGNLHRLVVPGLQMTEPSLASGLHS